MWTLQYFGDDGMVEKSLADWGICGSSPFEFYGNQKSAVHIVTTDNFDSAFQFAYNKKVIIWRDRGENFTGGAIWFQGFVADPARNAQGERQNHQYTFYDWLDWASRISFRQSARQLDGFEFETNEPVYSTVSTEEVVLGETLEEELQNVGQQITEILTALNQRYNPTRWRSHVGAVDESKDLIQIGVIGVDAPMPRTPARCITCFEALRDCMKQVPDAVMSTDYSTTPPMVNVTRLANMGIVNVVLPGEDVTAVFPGLTLKPRYDRQLNGVLIIYKYSGSLNGRPTLKYSQDIFPVNADPDDPLVLTQIIELSGVRATRTITKVQTFPVNAKSAVDADRIAWWQAHDDRLKNENIVAGTLAVDKDSVTIKDSNGNDIDLAQYGYELNCTHGQITPGMNINSIEAVITGDAAWTRNHDVVPVPVEKGGKQQIHARLTLCNLNTAGAIKEFTTTSVEDTGEGAPVGMAQYLYTAYQSLQHQGTLNTVGKDVRGDIVIGKKLTIQTPGNNFANNLIQGITGEIFKGALNAQIGPPGVLSPSDIIEQLRVARVANWKLPSGRKDGSSAGSSLTALGDAAGKENTIPGLGQPAQHTATALDANGNLIFSQLGIPDPANPDGQMIIATYKPAVAPAAPAIDTTKPQIIIRQSDIANILGATTPTPIAGATAEDIKTMKPREVKMCDDAGNQFYAIIHCTSGYTKS